MRGVDPVGTRDDVALPLLSVRRRYGCCDEASFRDQVGWRCTERETGHAGRTGVHLLCYCPRHSPTKTICSCLALYSPFTTGSAAEYESFLMVFACYFRKLTILLVCSGFWVLYTVLDMVGGMREGCGYRSTVLLPEVLTLNKSDMKYSRCYLLWHNTFDFMYGSFV